MARTKKDPRGTDTAEDTKADNVLLSTYVSPELASQVDEIRWSKRIEGRAATVRYLIEEGLKAISPGT